MMRSAMMTGAMGLLAGALCAAPLGATGQQTAVDATVERTAPRIMVATVERAPIVQWRFAEGVTQALRKEHLFFETTGRVVEIGAAVDGRPLREGARVRGPSDAAPQGQMLARLDARAAEAQLARANAERDAARQRVEAAQADEEQAQADSTRQAALRESGRVSDAAYEAAETAARVAEAAVREAAAAAAAADAAQREALLEVEKTVLRAPFDGVVAFMNLRQGDFPTLAEEATSAAAREGDAAVVLIDDSALEIVLQTPPFEARGLSEGQRALVALDGAMLARATKGAPHPDVVEAKVWSVSPSVSLERRAVLVRVRSTETLNGRLRDGDFVSVWIAAEEKPDALTLPYEAVTIDRDAASVFVIDQNNRVTERPVEIGLLGLERVEVVAGLEEGARVATHGRRLLRDGALARIVDGPQP